MEFLDIVKIGSPVNVNVNLSKDRLNTKTLEALNKNSSCFVRDFRITDGKGIGVVVELANGEKEWFFDNEIEILDENGKVMPRNEEIEGESFIKELFKNISYTPKRNIKELINPFNFLSWLIFSLKDIF